MVTATQDAHRKARQRLLARAFGGDVYRYDRRTATNCGPCGNAGVESFIETCERGGFYETLMRPGDDRDTFKPDLFRQVFFGRNRSSGPRPLLARFRATYPDVADVLRELKRKSYRQSAWTLQNAESALCVGRVCGRLMAERPGLAVFTIHGSWLVRAGDAGYVRSVVEDEFRSAGAAVTVRVKTPEGR